MTGKLLRKAQRNVSVEAFRNRCAKVASGEEVALIVGMMTSFPECGSEEVGRHLR